MRTWCFVLVLASGCAPSVSAPSARDLGHPRDFEVAHDLLPPEDLAGADFASNRDLAVGDLAGADFAGADLAVASDLSSSNTDMGGCHPVVNEVQTGDKMTGTDEFVEIANLCAGTIDVSGWSIVYRSTGNNHPVNGADTATLYTWPATSSLASGKYFVVAGSGFGGTKDQSESAGIGASGAIGLRDGANNLIDSVGFGTDTGAFVETAAAPLPPTVNAPGNSISRLPDGTDTNDNSKDFKVSTKQTPGAANQ